MLMTIKDFLLFLKKYGQKFKYNVIFMIPTRLKFQAKSRNIYSLYIQKIIMKTDQFQLGKANFQQYQYSNQVTSSHKEKSQNYSNTSNLSMKNLYNFSNKNDKYAQQLRKNSFEKSDQVSMSKVSPINNNQNLDKKTKQKYIMNAISTLQKIKEWRLQNEAPVDVVGCQMLHDVNEPIEVQKYQTLIALMLSIQTKDEITGKVMQRLKKYGLKPSIMSQISQQNLLQLIRQANFNKRKAKNIIEVSKQVCEKGLPTNKQQLMEYPGVGVKIATLYMRTAEGVNDGIGVDTHVHRISNRLAWVNNTKNPIETEQQLQKLFPKQYWNQINIALVGFGQTLCSAKKPKCGECPVRNICPSSLFGQQF